MLCTGFAFIEMTIGHLRMLVKFGYIFDFVAFKTAFPVHASYNSCELYEVN